MTAKYVINAEVQKAIKIFLSQAAQFDSLIDQTRQDILDDAAELRTQWDDAPEGWQNSERGMAVDEWITSYEALGDLLEQVHDALEPATGDLEMMEPKP